VAVLPPTHSHCLRANWCEGIPNYSARFDLTEPVWQPRYYSFNIYSKRKLLEKLNYMHHDQVRAGLATAVCEWEFSSARFFESESSGTFTWYSTFDVMKQDFLSLCDPDV